MGGTFAGANGTVTVSGDLHAGPVNGVGGGATASNGGILNVTGTIFAEGASVLASGSGSQLTAGTIVGNFGASSGGSVTAQQVSADSSNDVVNITVAELSLIVELRIVSVPVLSMPPPLLAVLPAKVQFWIAKGPVPAMPPPLPEAVL